MLSAGVMKARDPDQHCISENASSGQYLLYSYVPQNLKTTCGVVVERAGAGACTTYVGASRGNGGQICVRAV